MARLTQQQVEAWIAQNGGPQSVQYSVEQKSIRNPSLDPAEQALQPFVTIEVEVWRNSKTGAELSARRQPEGDFDVIENKGADPNKPGGTQEAAPPDGKPYIDDGPEAGASGRRWGWNPQTRTYDRNLGPSPSAQKPPEPTSTETKKPVATHPGYTEVTTTDKQTGKAEIYYLDPNGNRVNALPEKPPTAAERVGSPTGNTRSRVEGGQTIKEAEYVLPDGTKEWRSQTAPAEGTTVDLAGAPQLDLSTPERARATYNELFLFVDREVRAGRLSAEKGKAYLAGPHSAVANVLDEAKEQRATAEGLRRDQLTERSQDMTQTGNRLQFGQNAASTAIKTSGDLIKAAEGGESTIVPLMVLQAGMGQAMGGFRESPSVTLGSGLLPRVAQQAGEGFTAPANPAMVGQPNQLGIGAVPGVMTPTGAVPSGADVAAANAASQAQSQAAFGALGVPPARPTSPVAPVFRPPPPVEGSVAVPPAINPPAGESGNDPTQPVGMMPNQILRSGMGVGTRTADDLERELLEEGFSPEEIRAARRRAEARAGLAVV